MAPEGPRHLRNSAPLLVEALDADALATGPLPASDGHRAAAGRRAARAQRGVELPRGALGGVGVEGQLRAQPERQLLLRRRLRLGMGESPRLARAGEGLWSKANDITACCGCPGGFKSSRGAQHCDERGRHEGCQRRVLHEPPFHDPLDDPVRRRKDEHHPGHHPSWSHPAGAEITKFGISTWLSAERTDVCPHRSQSDISVAACHESLS